ncbi:MAG: hypothetical protein QM703_03630 [Gemmatales bacterium]
MMADSWVGLGLVAWGKKQWQESAQAYSRAHQLLNGLLKENPRNLDAAAALGALCINQALLDQDRNDPEAALGHFSEAIATLEAARAQEPNFIRLRTALYNAYAARASLHRTHSRFREAAVDIEHCLPYAQPSRLPELWQRLAEDRLKADEPEQAVKALGKVHELDAARFQEFIRNNDVQTLQQRADYQQLVKKAGTKPIPK